MNQKKTKSQNTKHKIPNTNQGITLVALIIPFMVPKTGEYLCRMMIEKNEQNNATGNPLICGISSSPVTSYSTDAYDILNLNGSYSKSIKLNEGVQYYLGAVNRLTWNSWGYSRVDFCEIFVKKNN